MARMMVYLDDEDHKRLRRIAYEQRIPIAEQIRRAVRLYLGHEKKSGSRKAKQPSRKAAKRQ